MEVEVEVPVVASEESRVSGRCSLVFLLASKVVRAVRAPGDGGHSAPFPHPPPAYLGLCWGHFGC